MKIVAFLPVKLNSERVKGKNISILGNRPLFHWMLDNLLNSKLINEVYLDTESDEIIRLAHNYRCKILRRDPVFASNKTNGNILLVNDVAQIKADIYIQAFGTSPFIKPETIDSIIKKLIDDGSYDSALTVKELKAFYWNHEDKSNYDLLHFPNSFDLKPIRIETTGLYAIRSSAVKKLGRRVGDNPYFMNIPSIEALDIDYPDDFELAQTVAQNIIYKKQLDYCDLAQSTNSNKVINAIKKLGLRLKILPNYFNTVDNKRHLGHVRTLIPDFKQKSINPVTPLEAANSMAVGDIVIAQNLSARTVYIESSFVKSLGKININKIIFDGRFNFDGDNLDNLDCGYNNKTHVLSECKSYAIDSAINVQGTLVYPGDYTYR